MDPVHPSWMPTGIGWVVLDLTTGRSGARSVKIS